MRHDRIARGYQERPGRAARRRGAVRWRSPRAPSRARWWSSPCATRSSGRYFASVTHGQFGPHLFYTDDPDRAMAAGRGPGLPGRRQRGRRADLGHRARRRRRRAVVRRGAGGAVPQRRRRQDAGRWCRRLWDVPERPQWEPGAGGLCLHSICPWPGDPNRLAIGISVGGRLADGRCRQKLAARRRAAWCRATSRRRRARTRTRICVHNMRARAAPAVDALHAVPRRRLPLRRRRRELDRHRHRSRAALRFRLPARHRSRTTPTARSSSRWRPTWTA